MEHTPTDSESAHLSGIEISWERQRSSAELLGFIGHKLSMIPVDVSLDD